ncbi:MAG TPA: hypothetical protein DCS42_15550 [Nitrospiraceae bacterium]|nr:hypothetical protein [Nitrospiraceae bacterium]
MKNECNEIEVCAARDVNLCDMRCDLHPTSVGLLPIEFERELGKLIDMFVKKGLSKPDLVAKMRWMTGNCEMS